MSGRVRAYMPCGRRLATRFQGRSRVSGCLVYGHTWRGVEPTEWSGWSGSGPLRAGIWATHGPRMDGESGNVGRLEVGGQGRADVMYGRVWAVDGQGVRGFGPVCGPGIKACGGYRRGAGTDFGGLMPGFGGGPAASTGSSGPWRLGARTFTSPFRPPVPAPGRMSRSCSGTGCAGRWRWPR